MAARRGAGPAMALSFLRRRRAIGLDVGSGSVKALALERRRSEIAITGRAVRPLDDDAEPRRIAQAVHEAVATVGGHGQPVIAAVGGPDVVIRQLSLPPVPPAKIVPALEIQHRELGLLPPGEAVIDAQILRRSRDGVSNDVLSVSVPRARIDERVRLFELAAVDVQILDVEPLALLNGALEIMQLGPTELLVLLVLDRRRSVLCLFSEQGSVVARYLDIGAETFADQIRDSFNLTADAARELSRTLPPAQAPRVETVCRALLERIAEDVRLSLTFYQTEYDRESAPRFGIGGALGLPHLSRWIADRLGLDAPLEVMDPFRASRLEEVAAGADRETSGAPYLQAFGLALRGL